MELKWIIYLLIAWTISFGLTAVLMRPLLRLCKRRGMYDLPDERKVHHRGIPRLGGVLFMPAMLIGAAGTIVVQMLADYRGFPMLSVSVCVVFVGMFLIYLIGLLDDLFGLKASLKFLIQLFVSLFLPFCGLYMHNLYGLLGLYELPGWACYPLTVFVSLLIVNAINLIDGIDGLASGLSMVAVVAFGVLFFSHEMYYYALYCAALVGTVAAFFLYNMFGDVNKSTKTFMGDTGSLTLGYALTFLSIRYMMTCTATSPHQMHATALLVPYTLILVPCFDLVRVSLMRLWRRVPIFSPDKTHIHHKCLAAGFSMHQTLMIILALQAAFGGLNWLLVLADFSASLVLMVDIAVFISFHLILDGMIARREAK